MKETNNRTEVTVFMSQAGGIGAQASFTGPDATKILDRLSQFPQSVHDHPVGYEVELANYNTIPLPVPTAEESEDRLIVLQDCFAQKMGFLQSLSDLKFMLSENGSVFFENLPPQEELLKMQGQYRTALNALMAHAIRVSTGRMNPPQLFVASQIPPPLNFKKRPFTPLPSAPTMPNWVGRRFDDQKLAAEAKSLQLETSFQPRFAKKGQTLPVGGGVIFRTEPAAGAPILPGLRVTIEFNGLIIDHV
jgi:hypothetical protein